MDFDVAGTAFIICVFVFAFTIGNPDLIDALVANLMPSCP